MKHKGLNYTFTDDNEAYLNFVKRIKDAVKAQRKKFRARVIPIPKKRRRKHDARYWREKAYWYRDELRKTNEAFVLEKTRNYCSTAKIRRVKRSRKKR